MVTREQIIREIDSLPDNLLEELYLLLKNRILKKKATVVNLTLRNFHGKLDHADIRKSAYE